VISVKFEKCDGRQWGMASGGEHFATDLAHQVGGESMESGGGPEQK